MIIKSKKFNNLMRGNMSENIQLEIKNIGPIHEANIDLGKLNIIGGANSTGKSTSSRLLYCFLFSASKEGKNYYDGMVGAEKSQMGDSSSSQINQNEKYMEVMLEIFQSEFDYSPVDNEYGIGTASFKGEADENNNDFDWTLYVGHDESGTELRQKLDDPLFLGNVVYMDSISPLEVMRLEDNMKMPHHFKALFDKFRYKSERKIDEELNSRFSSKITDLIHGRFEYMEDDLDCNGEGFKFERDNVSFSMKTSSSGLKQIGSIQMLVNNNQLARNDFLIIDEPEVNLHPEWQVRLAELLVLLVHDLNVTVYVNSHSPHFIEAIEVLSVKYGLRDETRFYMTSFVEEFNKYDFVKLDYSNLRELYRNLGNPYNEINKIRLENDLKGL